MRGSSKLLLLAATAVLAQDLRGGGLHATSVASMSESRNHTLRVGAIFTREDMESGANIAFQVRGAAQRVSNRKCYSSNDMAAKSVVPSLVK